MPYNVHYTCAGRTDVGIIRSGNEDSYLVLPDKGVFIVADGMGGHAAGEVASEMAVQIIARGLDGILGQYQKRLAKTKSEIEQKKILLSKPNPQLEEYNRIQARLDEIHEELAAQAVAEQTTNEDVADGEAT